MREIPNLDKVAGQLVSIVAAGVVKKATKYLSPSSTVKATRQFPRDGRQSRDTILVTFGSPNYAEQEFIKQAKKAGEKFPIKKIQFVFYPD